METQLLEDVIVDYNEYTLSRTEWILSALVSGLIAWGVLFLFYGTVWIFVLAIPVAFFYPRIYRKGKIEKRRNRLTEQFKEMLYALSSAMQSGKSIEVAFFDIYRDLQMLYPDESTEIMCEARNIITNLNAGVPLEAVLDNFAQRAHLEDISNFVDIYKTTKRMGGNLVGVMRSTADSITEKADVQQEIDVAIASAKMEQRVLSVVPVGVLLMVRFLSPEYMENIYGDPFGIVISTISLAIFIFSAFVGTKITDIDI